MLNISRPQERWRNKRGNAEFYRKALFEALRDVPAQTSDPSVLFAAKLEYFRRYQYQVQYNYFSSRSREHGRHATRNDVARHAVCIVPVFVLVASLAVAMVMWAEQGFTNGTVNLLASWFWLAEQFQLDTVTIFLAILAGALSAGLFAISTLDNNRSNAVRYENMRERFEAMYKEENTGYDAALKAAIEGDERPGRSFMRRIHELMGAELQEWTRLQPDDLKQINRTATGAIPRQSAS
jgi:hypothetical protein